MTIKNAKRWFWWHKWTSLVCTIFLLILCITGLPLIFHEEIEALTEKETAAEKAENREKATLDEMVRNSLDAYPKKVLRYVFWEEEKPDAVYLSLSDSLNASPYNYKILQMNAHTGKMDEAPEPDEGFMYIMLRLHTDMFAGIGGKLFMGLMGILFVIAIISGVVLYGPIMKKYDFGMIRSQKSRRLKWLDMHNLLGIVVLAWTTVVGITGVINTLSDVVLGLWQSGQLAEMTAPYKNARPLNRDSLASLDRATQHAINAAPNTKLTLIAMPGTPFSSNHHYAVFVRGTTPVTSRILKPALVDAETGKLTDMRDMPWFVNALFVSQPLHFGDYGGLPLKIIWTLFDIATIAVLITGLYLWVQRLKSSRAKLNRLTDESSVVIEYLTEKPEPVE